MKTLQSLEPRPTIKRPTSKQLSSVFTASSSESLQQQPSHHEVFSSGCVPVDGVAEFRNTEEQPNFLRTTSDMPGSGGKPRPPLWGCWAVGCSVNEQQSGNARVLMSAFKFKATPSRGSWTPAGAAGAAKLAYKPMTAANFGRKVTTAVHLEYSRELRREYVSVSMSIVWEPTCRDRWNSIKHIDFVRR